MTAGLTGAEMAGKQSGLGDNLWIDQYDMAGGVHHLGKIACPVSVQEGTQGIKKYAMERLRLKADGQIDMTSLFNIDAVAGAEGAHVALKGLPRTDRQLTYCRGTAIGNAAASLISKQINYDGT